MADPPVPAKALKYDAKFKHAQDRDNKETQAHIAKEPETVLEAVLKGVSSFGANIGSTANDYLSKFKSMVIGKNDPVKSVNENDKVASPKVQTHENQDL